MTLLWECDNCGEQREVKRPRHYPARYPEPPDNWIERESGGDFCSEACWDEVEEALRAFMALHNLRPGPNEPPQGPPCDCRECRKANLAFGSRGRFIESAVTEFAEGREYEANG